MSGLGGLGSEEEVVSPFGEKIDVHGVEEKEMIDEEMEDLKDYSREKEEEEEEDEEEMMTSALLEPSTLPWPGDRGPQMDEDVWEEKRVLESEAWKEEEDEEVSGESRDPLEELSRAESDRKGKSRWRESMPEGDRWRDDEIGVRRDEKGDAGSLADDEDEEEEEEDEDEEKGGVHWNSGKATMSFIPKVIVRSSFKEPPEESRVFMGGHDKDEVQMEPDSVGVVYPERREPDDKCYLCGSLCSETVRVSMAMLAAAVLFPLLVWGGYALLPFDPPVIVSPPLRVVYTLRCAFFAIIPILLGMVVLGLARLRFNNLKPLHQSAALSREVAAQRHFVDESLSLFLFFFLQLAVMATYIRQDLVKLVPLLTIVFVFGRLFYWLCISLGNSSIRVFGFGLSFLPILVMLGANLYFVCSSVGQGAVFDVAVPTEAPPPRMRWWF
ncbi:transmembrane protein 79 [Antennarius striatus]|uniref:transmembrane protein 79 n=1 Tax=Antennarius striatus TaxID=241820 RepID=UPI0035AFF6E8